MPQIIVQVGLKKVVMPRLDIERVIALEDRPTFKHNIKTGTQLQTLKSEIKSLDKQESQLNGSDSFLNDTLSKMQSELHGPSFQQFISKQSSGHGQCDQAVSAIDCSSIDIQIGLKVHSDSLLEKEMNTDFNCSELALNSILNSSLNCGNLDKNLGKLNKITKDKHQVVQQNAV